MMMIQIRFQFSRVSCDTETEVIAEVQYGEIQSISAKDIFGFRDPWNLEPIVQAQQVHEIGSSDTLDKSHFHPHIALVEGIPFSIAVWSQFQLFEAFLLV